MENKLVDTEEVKRAVALLKKPGELFEIRIVDDKNTYSGYFKDVETMLSSLNTVRGLERSTIYILLNELHEGCYSRKQRDCFVLNVKPQTSDKDIVKLNYFFIDLDPIRPAGCSSTDEELAKSLDAAVKIKGFLTERGFSEPLIGCSGNGTHLLYSIDMENSQENLSIIENCLKFIDLHFSDGVIDIDQSIKNAARICKLYGTMAHKGANTEERPHRMSGIISSPAKLEITPTETLRKLSGLLDRNESASFRNRIGSSSFDLIEWLNRYQIDYMEKPFRDGTKYVLDHCPFDSSHTGKDAAILQRKDGTICFHCFHNSCADKGWKDVRTLFEPDAYLHNEYDARIEQGWKKHKADKKIPEADSEEIDLSIPTLDQFEEVEAELITAMMPKKGITSIVADGGTGKTFSWVGGLAAITRGRKSIFDCSAEGNENITYEPKTVMFFSAEDGIEEVLRKRFRMNDADLTKVLCMSITDDRFKHIKVNSKALAKLIEKYKPAVCVFDPLQAFIPANVHMGERNAMRQCMEPLLALGQKYGTAFIIVVHSNKREGAYGRNRVSDSSDIWDCSRSVVMMGNTSEPGIKYISHEKSNYGKQKKTVLFSIENDQVVFQGLSEKKDADFVAERVQAPARAERKEEARQFIIDTIKASGITVSDLRRDTDFMNTIPMGCKLLAGLEGSELMLASDELNQLAEANKIKRKTLMRAADELKANGLILRRPNGFGKDKKWYIILKDMEK